MADIAILVPWYFWKIMESQKVERQMENADAPPLYNSRVIQTYIDYLRTNHPTISIDSILQQSDLERYEIEDPAHWFTQDQVDRFHEALLRATGDEHISRHAGRFGASAKGIGLLKQYVLGLMNIETVYQSFAKLTPLLTKGAIVKARRLGIQKLEFISTPTPDADEKPYQCENRLGIIETLPKLFTNNYADIEHPECFHRGDAHCRYIVKWNTSRSFKLRVACHFSIILSIMLLLFDLFTLPSKALPLTAVLVCCNLILFMAYLYYKSKELAKVIDFYKETAEEQMESVSINYNNALLVQEIGQATAAIFDINELMNKLASLMQKHLPFKRGLIMLADEDGAHLVYSAGYGFDMEEIANLKISRFHLNDPHSRGAFVRSFVDQKCVIVNDLESIEALLSTHSRILAKKMGVFSFLCVPILFEQKSLGILAVDNIRSETSYRRSDVNLLQGIASHIAISINNSKSFRKLKESEAKYRQTLESIVEGYFEIDGDWKLVFANKAFCELLGYTRDELIDGPIDLHFCQNGNKSIEALFKGIQKNRKTIRFAHFKMTQKSGDTIPVDLSASLVMDAHGRMAGFRGLIRDATDRLTIEKEKSVLEKRLLQAQKMEAIGTLAGGIAHNFNNWLNGILGNAALIRIDGQKGNDVSERIQKIESIVESAAKMTQQLLGYARGGKYKVDLIDINKLIRESSETFSVARKDIPIQLNLDENIAAVKADQNQIEQVLWNLYANAMDAMPDGGKLVIATSNASVKDLNAFGHTVTAGRFVCVSITDSGMGIDPKYRQNIFEPFFTTKIGKGTGLGLASAYGIIKSHNGFINVKSSLGEGSTFYIFLPEVRRSLVGNDIAAEKSIRPGRETVLMVDDDESVMETYCRLLSEYGYTTLKAFSGEDALRIYSNQKSHIDIVIIDMIMPGMSGRELYAKLKEIDPAVKTLLSTGHSLNDQAQAILESGCNGFIQKPYDIYQLSDMINKIVNCDQKEE
jgi:PAS domain S-box-containing protein